MSKQLIEFFVFDSITQQYKTQDICDRVASEDLFLIVYCPDKYKTQEICDKVIGNFLAILKLIPDWFVASKIIKKLFTALYADGNIFHFDEDFDNVVFSCNEMGILNIDLSNTNLDINFNEDGLDNTILISLLAWHIKFEKHKALKKRIK